VKKGIILLSGGLDSATTAAIAIDMGYTLSALTFYYGQRHEIEIKFAERLADFFKIDNHVKASIPIEIFRSALIREWGIEVPKNRDIDADEIPETYVPARNILFLAYALAYGESSGAYDIFIGANAVDYSGYPDCRPEFFEAFKIMADKGTKAGAEGNGFTIHTPIIDMTKTDIIKEGTRLGVDYSLTHSCYDPSAEGFSCGSCDSCILRHQGFINAGVADPTRYRDKK
jgi:7-cyano-7-deazaguanine synthase